MAKFTYAITGATGHIGYKLTEELLKKGHKVRALGRDHHKLQELKAKGAEVIVSDLTDTKALTKAFKGCKAVFSLLPPAYDATDMEVFRDTAGEAIAVAVVKAKVSTCFKPKCSRSRSPIRHRPYQGIASSGTETELY